MFTLIGKLRGLRKDKSGVTALEYGLIAGLIAVVIIGAVTTLGTTVSGTFTAISNAMPAAPAAPAAN
jgi:pilus assembly protein Flp/PilA